MRLTIPEFSLVLLVGASGSGKSTFAGRHFAATEVLSSDYCRGLVSDDENDLGATKDAFDVLHFIARKRLAGRRLTVVDATNVRPEDRAKLVALAKEYHALSVAIVLNLPPKLCQDRNRGRPDRQFGGHVVRNQANALKRSLKRLGREGFRYVYTLTTPEEVEAATVERQRLWTDRRDATGPFDIIGDIHGCADELETLLAELGCTVSARADGQGARAYDVSVPEGRKVIFLGDLVDRGPRVADVLRIVMNMVKAGRAMCVLGNHEAKLLRKLRGKNVKVAHGLAETLAQFEREPESFHAEVADFIDGLISHYVLDEGRLTVAHAGLKESMQGRSSGAVRSFALYGETTGETDEFGLPIRYNWALDYRGRSKVVYGHTPVPEAEWLNGTICIDTGCVFGGKLTALRYPEMELVSVPATRVHMAPARPLRPAEPQTDNLGAQQQHDHLLDVADVQGKRIIATSLNRHVTIREENATAALEVMSRFAIDPKWLIYLPPTMAPSETSEEDGLLEHPAEAFDYFRQQGVARVVCEEKHMGSRAVLVVCRDEDAARRRFGVLDGEAGAIYTRTGRPFFSDAATEAALLERLRAALATSGFWETFESDWVCLDAELMPWSVKAQALLQHQYAPVGAAAVTGLSESLAALQAAEARGVALDGLVERTRERLTMAEAYRAAYRPYCWPVTGIDDLKLAPFHILASEGAVHSERDHLWHMETLAEICRADEGLLLATTHRAVGLGDQQGLDAATDWWQALTESGGEGMVVKPESFVVRGPKGLVQPAIKCRGREYLRIIYGPEYTAPENLKRLRRRGLGHKRSLALREFALGLTALERFVKGEPLRRVHECVFGVLALESEPVDPRL